MTCNDLNTIPPALIRPGRIDLKLHMGYIDNYQAELIFWKFFCMSEKEKELDDIPKSNYPKLARTVNELIKRMRELASQQAIQLEISPAELISYLLFHALRYNLSKNPDSLSDCCQSLLDHIPDFIKSVTADRIQAIEHGKKKLKRAAESSSSAAAVESKANTNGVTSSTTTTTTIVTTKEIIPTPPTSPAAGKKTASEVVKVTADEE
jgi:hypothetical protein